MRKYLVEVMSSLLLDEENMQHYIADREREWGGDFPEEVQKLKDTGRCKLSDKFGTTSIIIREIEDNDKKENP